jgi:nitrogen fixation protein FixH
MSPTTLPTTRKPHGLQGRHVAGIFFSFFAIVLAMNGAMMYSAISTYSGIVANEPYRKGLHYNDRISADAQQARLGWADTITMERRGRIVVTLHDAEGRSVTGTRIDIQLGRPSTNLQDTRLQMVEATPGRYEAQAGPLDEGSWVIALEVRADDISADPIYRARRRLWLKP